MITNQDRSYYIGASDTSYVVGNWKTKTFEKWWLEKLGLYKNNLKTEAMQAGTNYEHKILDALNIVKLEKDKQIIIGRLRVNLDGNTEECIFEVKTYKTGKEFKVSKQYWRQAQVEMYASGIHKLYIVAYELIENDYKNFFNIIDPKRIKLIPVEYDKKFIDEEYLPQFNILSECLEKRSVSMQTTGSIVDVSLDILTRKPKLTLLLDSNEITNINELKGSKLNVELKKWYKKRSLNANAYCWVLCNKIAKKLSSEGTIVTKDDVYKDTIFNIGTFQPMIVEEKALNNFIRIWHKQGLGYLVQEVSRKNKCVKIHAYYGSSSYDTQEMSLLINNLIELAKSLDVETKSKNEIESLLKEWEK